MTQNESHEIILEPMFWYFYPAYRLERFRNKKISVGDTRDSKKGLRFLEADKWKQRRERSGRNGTYYLIRIKKTAFSIKSIYVKISNINNIFILNINICSSYVVMEWIQAFKIFCYNKGRDPVIENIKVLVYTSQV